MNMLSIRQIATAQTAILEVRGKLFATETDELLRLSQSYLQKGKSVVVDLSRVRFIDSYGIRLIVSLTGNKNFELINCPFYIRRMLERYSYL